MRSSLICECFELNHMVAFTTPPLFAKFVHPFPTPSFYRRRGCRFSKNGLECLYFRFSNAEETMSKPLCRKQRTEVWKNPIRWFQFELKGASSPQLNLS